MLNFISTNKVPNFQYTDVMNRFLMNTLAFSVGLVTKDYSTFDTRVLELMKDDPSWLEDSVLWCQSIIISSLVDSGNYNGESKVTNEFNYLLNLYDKATDHELSPVEENLFTNIHDKFLALLLTDKVLIDYLLEGR